MTDTGLSDEENDILRLESFSVFYGSNKIVHDISLSVRRGEIVGILGPNGAGKTSLMRALVGNAEWSGKIFFNGKKVTSPEEYFPDVAIAPQVAGLFSYLTARENIDFIGAMTANGAASEDKRTPDEVLSLVDLCDRADDLVSVFSGGMRQRLNFAVAVINNPLLLFLDEPASGVDVHARQSLNRAMRTHADRGSGIMLVTHEHDEAETICDRIIILADGKCIAFGAPKSLITQFIPQKYEACISVRNALPPEVEKALENDGFEKVRNEEWRALKAHDHEALSSFHNLTNAIGETAASLTIQHVTLSSLMRKLIRGHRE